MKQSVDFGICEFCKDEYDEPKPSKLYKLNGKLMCGSCASEVEGDREFVEMAYGVD